MGLCPLEFLYFFPSGVDFIRQNLTPQTFFILTYKVGPRTERVNVLSAAHRSEVWKLVNENLWETLKCRCQTPGMFLESE